MLKFALPATLALLPAAASAQTVVDVGSLTQLDEIDVVTSAGDEIGDVEAGLIGADGSLVAFVVEVGGWLGVGEEDRVIPLERLTFQNGDYVTDLAEDELEQMPEWDD